MCGRYYIGDELDWEELKSVVDAVNRVTGAEGVKTRGEIFPADTVPVLARSRGRKPGLFPMQWGYALPDGKRVINARSETAGERPLFRDGLRARRCLVPASNYFEWAHAGRERTKYAIRPAAGGSFFLAGVYRLADGRPEFSILTREPGEQIAFIHDRMPVILPLDAAANWLAPEADAAPMLMRAVTDVRYEPASRQDGEQLRMEL